LKTAPNAPAPTNINWDSLRLDIRTMESQSSSEEEELLSLDVDITLSSALITMIKIYKLNLTNNKF
jgi:hypothetical protein